MIIDWDDSFKTGDEKLDSDHKEMVKHFNKIERALESRKEEANIGAIRETIDFIAGYMENHFEYEKEYLKVNAVKGVDECIKEQKKLREGFKKFREDFHDMQQGALSFNSLKKLLRRFHEEIVTVYMEHLQKVCENIRETQ